MIIPVTIALMARCGAAVTPLLTHWSCCSHALIHRYLHHDSQIVWHFSLSNLRISVLFLFSFFLFFSRYTHFVLVFKVECVLCFTPCIYNAYCKGRIVIADSALMTLYIAILSLTMMLMTCTCVNKDYYYYYY